ncbi:MAG: hypothetical protein IPJ85_18030 [Flavobacteriales bacterium]|nr:hypothetical protein [Flavobacteriales bacterium]
MRGQPKTKKPKAAKWANSQELDPAMPPLENVIIYLNGGKVDGERYVVGYAQMHVKSKALGLTDDIGQARVAFSATDDPEGNAFLFFDHNVTTFGNALINCAFTDGDDDPQHASRIAGGTLVPHASDLQAWINRTSCPWGTARDGALFCPSPGIIDELAAR